MFQNHPLKKLVYNEVLETIAKAEAKWPNLSAKVLEGDLRMLVEEIATEHPEYASLETKAKDEFVQEMVNELTGYGPLTSYLNDDSISEIMVNGTDQIYVERQGRIAPCKERFISQTQLMRVIRMVIGPLGRRIDELNPMVDARLPDGSRINVAIPPIAIDGPYLTIRKFSKRVFSLADLVKNGTIDYENAEVLSTAVKNKETIIVSGGTGTGKTTMLNVLATQIPKSERIVTIEDAAELKLECPHVVRLEARPPGPDGKGEITIRQLVRNALRMRPDRIIIGEVRGSETLDLVQALNTGHRGSLSTVHAENPVQALYRLETMSMLAGFDIPLSVVRRQISDAVKYIVHLERLSSGSRKVVCITRLEGTEGGEYVLKDLYRSRVAA